MMDGKRLAHILFHMNNPKVVAAMGRIYTEKEQKEILDYMREHMPEACVMCEAYYNEFDENGVCIGYRCALDKEIHIEDRESVDKNCPRITGKNIWKKEPSDGKS